MKTQDELKAIFLKLKDEFGTIFTLTIESDAITQFEGEASDLPVENYTFYLKKLDRVTYSMSMKLMEQDVLKATELLLKNLYIGGDDVNLIYNDFDMLRTASSVLGRMYWTKNADLKKN